MPFNFKNFLINLFANTLIDEGTDYLSKFLEGFYVKKPVACGGLVSSLYIAVDIFAEDYAKTTGTSIDDKAVAEIKKDLEAFAAAHSITLQNLDND